MWNTDIRRYGPKAYISSIVIDFKQYYVGEVKKRLEGTWTPSTTILPMGAGVDRDAWGESVPEEVRKQADAVREKILGGWSPFVGEIKDAKGNVKAASGQRMSEAQLYNWDWPIAGISGL
ncbi:hypothetical protein AAFX91_23745 [Bradyrhizobium sp. 31Argb]|uniref:hypothetical protein n=1 Tax=Bradyrhizobium sp. 31Argb TaxID=3141247 RepID=UPI00374878EB